MAMDLRPSSLRASRLRRNPFDLSDDFSQRSVRFFQLEICLQAQPEALTGTQGRSKTHGRVRRDHER
jgi:hypothetical protein